MYHTLLRFRSILALVALALGASACSTDDVASPRALGRGFIPSANGMSFNFTTGTGNQLTFHSNKQKPSDKGLRVGVSNAGGRSGSATIQCRAYFGRDGMTNVEITTGDFAGDYLHEWRGNIVKAHVKIAKGYKNKTYAKFWGTHNFKWYNGGFSYHKVGGILRSVPLEITAHVRDWDGARTDVVDCSTSVGDAPDLAVAINGTHLLTEVNVPTAISATVENLSPDWGSFADCYLYINNVKVDSLKGMYVDAGQGAGCLFSYTFPTAGTYEVRVEAPISGFAEDRDPSNNVSTKNMYVEDLSGGGGGGGGGEGGGGSGDPRNFRVIVDKADINARAYTEYRVQTVAPGVVDSLTTNHADQNSTIILTGFGLLQFPLTSINVSQTTDLGTPGSPSVTIHTLSRGVTPTTGTNKYDEFGGNYLLNISVAPAQGRSKVKYASFYDGTIYLSYRFIDNFVDGLPVRDVYIIRDETIGVMSPTPFGSQLTFNINVQSPGGNMVFPGDFSVTGYTGIYQLNRSNTPMLPYPCPGTLTGCIQGRSFNEVVYHPNN